MKKKLLLLVLLAASLLPQSTYAVCPVCTIAVTAGVGLSRWLGIDDSISGVWIGGLTVSLIIWTLNWFEKKDINFKLKETTTWLGYYLLIVGGLYFSDMLGHELNILWGVDKLILGIIIGSIGFFSANKYYELLKKNNNGHAYFPFQKVVMPISALAILSLIFYVITK